MLWSPSNKILHRRRGFVLLAVLVVVVLLSLAAYQFSELMTAEYKAADSYTRSAQARALANSGVDYAAAVLSNPNTLNNLLGGNPFDNVQAFQGIVVNPQDPPRLQGCFSIVSPLYQDDPNPTSELFRFGVTDESSKINLNALMQLDSSGQVAHDMLMTLPNMTEDVADSIVDWMDPDDEPRTNGAEDDYYQTLNPPYHVKNGPLTSVEELLLVKGVTPQLLLGNDRNRNGILDPDEDDGSGVVNPGWAAYLTVYSREQNVDSQGNQRIYVNDPDLQTLAQNLTTAVGQDLANYIIAYRIYGPAASSSPPRSNAGSSGRGGSGRAASPAPAASGKGATSATAPSARTVGPSGGASGAPARLSRNMLNLRGGGSRSISSLYELINSQVSIPASSPGAPPTIYPSPLNDPGQLRQLLPLLLDEVTTVNSPEIPARINVSTAPSTVLAALPGLAETDIESILDHRPDPSANEAPDPIFQTPAWLITEANLAPSTMRSLERYITARTQVYRLQVIGYMESGGPAVRIEVVIDTNQQQPRILYWRDLTDLGRGFDLATNGPAPSGQ